MYIANVETNNEWQDVADLVSAAISDTFAFSSDTTYHITNNSAFAVYLVNIDTKPENKYGVGMRLPAGAQAIFKPGDSLKLWAISPVNKCDLSVEAEG